jgi:hypothetical protein
VPRDWRITYDYVDLEFEGTMRVEVADDGRVNVVELVARARDGYEVTGDQLRRFPVREVVREAMRNVLRDQHQVHLHPLLTSDLRLMGDYRRLQRVALVYQLAQLELANVVDAVAQSMDVSTSTAERLIGRARQDGHLPERS